MGGLGRRGIAGALLFWIMPAAATAGALALAPLLALCAAIGAPWRAPKQLPLAAWLLIAAAAWTALSVLWSPMDRPEQALKNLLAVVAGLALIAGLDGADARARGWVRASVLAGALILTLLLAIEAAFDMPFNRAAQPFAETGLLQRNPGRGVLVLEFLGYIALAAALMLRTPARWIASAALVLAMGWLSLQFNVEANAVAFVVGGAMFAVGYFAPRLGPLLVGGAWAAWMLLAPWVMLSVAPLMRRVMQDAPLSWGMRMQIWDFTSTRITEKFWFGRGLDASRNFHGWQELQGHRYPAIPLHPHSFSLQVWLETGAVGALLFAAAFAACGVACMRWCAGRRLPAAAATGCFFSLGLVWNLSYGAWQEWYMALAFIAAAGVIALSAAEAKR